MSKTTNTTVDPACPTCGSPTPRWAGRYCIACGQSLVPFARQHPNRADDARFGAENDSPIANDTLPAEAPKKKPTSVLAWAELLIAMGLAVVAPGLAMIFLMLTLPLIARRLKLGTPAPKIPEISRFWIILFALLGISGAFYALILMIVTVCFLPMKLGAVAEGDVIASHWLAVAVGVGLVLSAVGLLALGALRHRQPSSSSSAKSFGPSKENPFDASPRGQVEFHER